MLILALLLGGCGGKSETDVPDAEPAPAEAQEEAPKESRYLPEHPPGTEAPEEEADANLSPEEQAAREREREAARREEQLRALLDGMTLEQKVGQLFFVRCPSVGAADKIAQYHLGGVLLFTRDYKDTTENWLTADAFADKLQSYQTAAKYDTGIPLFIGSDEEGGTVTRASRNPNLFPEKSRSPQELYAAGGIGAILNDTMQKSYRLRELGVNVNFAPVCDVSTDPNDFIYARTLGLDARATANYVARVVLTMGDAGMGSVLKHFPGYGNNVDTHTGVAVDSRPYTTFEASDFIPFVAGIRAGGKLTPFVLVSHNIVECMDDAYPASLSPAVHRILRETLGFSGVVLTDDLAMDAVKAYAKDGRVAVLALQAGNDMIVTTDFETEIAEVLAAVADGTLDESVIDEACLRVLRAKAERFVMPYDLK